MQKGRRGCSGPRPTSLTGRLWWVQQTMAKRAAFLTILEDEPSHCWQTRLFCTNPRLSRCNSRCHVRKREDGTARSSLHCPKLPVPVPLETAQLLCSYWISPDLNAICTTMQEHGHIAQEILPNKEAIPLVTIVSARFANLGRANDGNVVA